MKKFDPQKAPLKNIHLIEASAGTGKTYNITLMVQRLLLEKKLDIEQILVVTFTEAATCELRQKIRTRLSETYNAFIDKKKLQDDPELSLIMAKIPDKKLAEQKLKNSLENFDKAQVFTIHGFCHKMLLSNALESNCEFAFEIEKNQGTYLLEMAKDFFVHLSFKKSNLLFNFFVENQLNPQKLATVAQLSLSRPALEFSYHPTKTNIEHLIKKEFKSLKKTFSEHSEDLPSLFANSTSIDKRVYNKKHVPTWLAKARILFENEELTFIPKEDFELFRFSSQAIEERTKMGMPPLLHKLFEKISAFQILCQKMKDEILLTQYEFIEYAHNKISQKKAQEQILFFDDLLFKMDSAISSTKTNLSNVIQQKYKAVLIDEFQDTDTIQYHIFKNLFKDFKIPFFMIGDPKQAIYSFRGGDIFTYIKAANDAQIKTSLDTNWRSDPGLIKCVNELFKKKKSPFILDQIQFEPVVPRPNSQDSVTIKDQTLPPFQFLFISRNEHNTNKRDKNSSLKTTHTEYLFQMAQDIINILSNKTKIMDEPITPKDIAVLVRTNSQAQMIEKILTSVGIPAYCDNQTNIFSSYAARDFFIIFKSILEPENIPYLKAALSTHVFGLKGELLYNLSKSNEALMNWKKTFIKLQEILMTSGFALMMAHILKIEIFPDTKGIKSRIIASDQSDKYLIDFLHVASILQEKASTSSFNANCLLEYLEKEIQESDTQIKDFNNSIKEKDSLKIATIHKSKGLQYNIVYCPYLWNSTKRSYKNEWILYHNPDKDHKLICDPGTNDKKAHLQKSIEDSSEEFRLLYVALTRAKHMCKILWGAFKDYEQSALFKFLKPTSSPENQDDFKHWSDEQIIECLKEFCSLTDNSACVYKLETQNQKYSKQNDETVQLNSRTFSKTILVPKKDSSFSSISKTLIGDELLRQHTTADSSDTPSPDIFLEATSQGRNFGNCVHKIFETTDFACNSPEDINDAAQLALHSHGFLKTPSIEDVSSWIFNILNTPLSENITLSNLDFTKCYNELEFVIPMTCANYQNSNLLAEAMNTEASGLYADYATRLSKQNIPQIKGFLKGFIDLVFEHEKKWYIVDYKTNFLGNHTTDYLTQNIALHMKDSHYYLQYHFYTLALHNFLNLWKKDYSYQDHFGGVYYLFLRGMKKSTNSGIFYDKPPYLRIKKLTTLSKTTLEAN